jgi:hypothetical protein
VEEAEEAEEAQEAEEEENPLLLNKQYNAASLRNRMYLNFQHRSKLRP